MVVNHFAALPNELIYHIFSEVADLNAEPPSSTKFTDDPSPELTRNDHQPIKVLSLVCRRWRVIVLPELFKHSRVSLNCAPQWLRLCPSVGRHLRQLSLKSARASKLLCDIQALESRQLNQATVVPEYFDALTLFEYVSQEDGNILRDVPSQYLHWIPSQRGNVGLFLKFIEDYQLTARVKSLVVYTEQEVGQHRKDDEELLAIKETTALWRNIFKCINPSSIVIAAPPSTMAALASSREDSDDTWAFEMPLHYLCLSTLSPHESVFTGTSRPYSSSSQASVLIGTSPNKTFAIKPSSPRSPTCLLNMRRWRHIRYNEGTMIKGYSHYEYQWKAPPRILPVILLWLSKEPTHSPQTPQILSIEYTSLFPYKDHINIIAGILPSLRSLQYFDVKLASTKMLDDKMKVGRAQMGDVWQNWKDSYDVIWRKWLGAAPVGAMLRSRDVEEGERLVRSIRKRLHCERLEKTLVGQKVIQVLREETDEGRWVRIGESE
jgi:hypothetical protein